MNLPAEFFDQEIEPKAICGNCDYHAPHSDKGQICINTRSLNYCKPTLEDDTCNRFWFCSKRWPDADHD